MRFVIEVDGSIHLLEEIHQNDLLRENYLNSLGLYVLRFTNDQVLFDLEKVMLEIAYTLPIISWRKPEWHDLNFREE